MDFLYQYLPKDLVNIIEEYAKDRTNYDKVISDLKLLTSDVRMFCIKDSEECFMEHFILNVFNIQPRVLGTSAVFDRYYVPEYWWKDSHFKNHE